MRTVHRPKLRYTTVLAAAASLLLAAVAVQAADRQDALTPNVSAADTLDWAVPYSGAGAALSISGPGDIHFTQRFEAGQQPTLSLSDNPYGALPAGQYTYEIRPHLSTPDGQQREIVSGGFTVKNGQFIAGGKTEPSNNPLAKASTEGSLKDQVILDDLIVDGSACIGFDCVNGESFGFDTIRLKENNLRIKFDDTSTSSSFPRNDWQLTANDSANGGASKFSIDDITNSRTPFTVEATAPSNSLYVDDGGRLGFGTANPVVEGHFVDGDTPTARLEQDGSSGFAPQTWDLAGNETNFFVRDVTNGSQLPFRIRPGAPTSSIDIAGDGHVGVGTASPAKQLHVRSTNSDSGINTKSQIRVENASSTEAARELFRLQNNGGLQFVFRDTSSDTWSMTADDTKFRFNSSGLSGAINMDIFENGNVEIAGTLTEGSSRSIKQNIADVDPDSVLAKLEQLEITTWSYQTLPGQRHLGPMAEDFYALFGLGPDPKHIAPKDLAGVAMVSAKELNERTRSLQKELHQKEQRIQALEERLERLENRLN